MSMTVTDALPLRSRPAWAALAAHHETIRGRTCASCSPQTRRAGSG